MEGGNKRYSQFCEGSPWLRVSCTYSTRDECSATSCASFRGPPVGAAPMVSRALSQPGDATPFDAGLISSITSKPSAHVCASWCHWDWEENCGADQCVWCDVCQGIMPPPASPVPPSFPPGVIGANCDETCASSEQCSDARCSRCTFCEHGFHLADAHGATTDTAPSGSAVPRPSPAHASRVSGASRCKSVAHTFSYQIN